MLISWTGAVSMAILGLWQIPLAYVKVAYALGRLSTAIFGSLVSAVQLPTCTNWLASSL
jgi:hypothetical protein